MVSFQECILLLFPQGVSSSCTGRSTLFPSLKVAHGVSITHWLVPSECLSPSGSPGRSAASSGAPGMPTVRFLSGLLTRLSKLTEMFSVVTVAGQDLPSRLKFPEF